MKLRGIWRTEFFANGETNLATYQPAIWYALDATSISFNNSGTLQQSDLSGASLAAYNDAAFYIAFNESAFLNTIAPDIQMYSPVIGANAGTAPQEFITYAVPEPASFVLMGGLLLLGGLTIKKYRRH